MSKPKKEVPYYGENPWSFKRRKRHREGWKPKEPFQSTYCKNGHEYTEENTIWNKNKDKKVRQCRACRDVAILRSRVKKYGITVEEYHRIFHLQNGMCFICKKSPITDIDHCHSSNKFRGLLCNNCNMGLGFFKDSISALSEAIKYLDTFQN